MKTDTAYYVFDLGRVRDRVAYLRRLLGTEVSLAYAVKANTFIIEGILPYVERLEVCSPGEAAICEKLGVPPEKMVISGVYKTPRLLERSVKSAPGRMDELLAALEAEYGYRAEELEYGTGFPVSYYDGESLDEEALITGFAQVLRDMTCKPKITLELGRSIAACCGKYYTHVVDKKRNKGQNYLLVDGGMHQLVYFGQFLGMKQPILSVCG